MSALPRALGCAVLGGLALLTGGCGAFRAQPVSDTLQDWSPVPLVADAALAGRALATDSCHAGADPIGINVVLQDRRTRLTAAFLMAGPGWSGSCMLSSSGNAGGGGRSAPLDPLTAALAVDERQSGGVGGATASLLGGRAAAGVSTVQVTLPSGQVVTASVGGGHWLAWWPGEALASRVVALDASGTILLTLTDTTPGFQQK